MNMEQEKSDFFNLEIHSTKDTTDQHTNGSLTVIWRDWDKIVKYHPKMVYVSSVNSGEVKGPHVHTKRNSYFTCIRGKVVFIIREESGKYLEIESSEKKPVMVFVPKNVPSAHINTTDEAASVLTLADVSWKPNDDEMKNISFDNYDWNKWNISS